jgi:hypothetical protein
MVLECNDYLEALEMPKNPEKITITQNVSAEKQSIFQNCQINNTGNISVVVSGSLKPTLLVTP